MNAFELKIYNKIRMRFRRMAKKVLGDSSRWHEIRIKDMFFEQYFKEELAEELERQKYKPETPSEEKEDRYAENQLKLIIKELKERRELDAEIDSEIRILKRINQNFFSGDQKDHAKDMKDLERKLNQESSENFDSNFCPICGKSRNACRCGMDA